MSRITIWTVIVLSCGSNGAVRPAPTVFQNDGCPVGLRETLERGGFSGVVFCRKPNAEAKFTLVGIAATADGKYTVYDYRYRFLPEHGSVCHGGQRMIVIRNNEYLGQFVLNPPTTITLRGNKLTLSKPDVQRISVDLAKRVPREILFDGDVMHLER
jgi:hypothetical protein